jgi:hypothetical protein
VPKSRIENKQGISAVKEFCPLVSHIVLLSDASLKQAAARSVTRARPRFDSVAPLKEMAMNSAAHHNSASV